MVSLYRLLARVIAIGSVLLVLTSCIAIDVDIGFTPDEAIARQIVTQDSDRFPEVRPLALTQEIQNFVDSNISITDTDQEKVEILRSLLFDEEYLAIQYADGHTQTAAEVFESRTGNCLSVINLYIAMARYVGINADFQTVQVRPTWDRRGSLFVLNQHINATGKVTYRDSYIIDFTPEVAVQQLTSQVIADSQARALYFNNLGVERMIAGDLDLALEYLQNAVWIDSELSIAWNNIGIVYNRLGMPELTEYSYQMAFHVDQKNATAINNLATFYNARGDVGRADTYRRAIARFNSKNPYFHFNRGSMAYQVGDMEKAVEHFRRAIRIKEVEPDFYIALAAAYSRLGNSRLQRQSIEKANQMVATNLEIIQPSDQKVRFIDEQSILRGTNRGLSVQVN